MAIKLAAAVTSFLIAFLVIPVIIKYFLKYDLVEVQGKRKIHRKITPSMGGVAIFLAFFLSSLVWIEFQYWSSIKFILVALFIIFLIGVRDDLIPLRPLLKLVGQLMAASMVIFLFDLRLHSFYGLFSVFELPQVVSYALTFFIIIIITNSFNLIDGLDGLAGTIALIASISFGTWFYFVGDNTFSILSFSMAGAIIGFLWFNWEPSKIFMGDTGALVVGMFLAVLTIYFINSNEMLPPSAPYKFNGIVGMAISFIIIPLIDTSRIIILRFSRGQSPLKADKSHIHHAIMRLGKTHSQTTLILAATHVVFIAIALLFQKHGDKYLLSGIVIIATILSITLDRLILKKRDAKDLTRQTNIP